MTRATCLTAFLVTTSCTTIAVAEDTGSTDILRLTEVSHQGNELVVAVQVINDQALTAFDIPLRFGTAGDPIELTRVDFTNRVEHWDYTHAQIDNQSKTVVLGMFAVVGRMDQDADIGASSEHNSAIANLVFQRSPSHRPQFATFTTQAPFHELTFLYYRYEGTEAFVETYVPVFDVASSEPRATSLPIVFDLSRNSPNPFNASTRFTLSLPEASSYSIAIYNVGGQLVRSYEGRAEAGTHTFHWDGSDSRGNQVASGVYFYRAVVGATSATRTMMLLK